MAQQQQNCKSQFSCFIGRYCNEDILVVNKIIDGVKVLFLSVEDLNNKFKFEMVPPEMQSLPRLQQIGLSHEEYGTVRKMLPQLSNVSSDAQFVRHAEFLQWHHNVQHCPSVLAEKYEKKGRKKPAKKLQKEAQEEAPLHSPDEREEELQAEHQPNVAVKQECITEDEDTESECDESVIGSYGPVDLNEVLKLKSERIEQTEEVNHELQQGLEDAHLCAVTFENEKNDLEQRLQLAQQEVASLKKEKSDLCKNIQEDQERQDGLECDYYDLRMNFDAVHQENDDLREQLLSKSSTVESLMKQNQELRDQLHVQESHDQSSAQQNVAIRKRTIARDCRHKTSDGDAHPLCVDCSIKQAKFLCSRSGGCTICQRMSDKDYYSRQQYEGKLAKKLKLKDGMPRPRVKARAIESAKKIENAAKRFQVRSCSVELSKLKQ